MGVDIKKLGSAIGTISSSQPKTTAAAVGTVITAALMVASSFGIAIPVLAYTLGPIAGSMIYKMLPASTKEKIDGYVDDIEELADSVPAKAIEVVGSIEVDASYPEPEELKRNTKTTYNFNKKH